ncbi:hypothetical protein AOQ84DRAFT_353922 [Glonium stellatum]|uniref:PNPLA domain-containing protein n=1 Tax=Glonium stellatum TaxID=574774 RepID=A0A8E2F3L7_9PEZI|nr:hypothetical protein AOQ84DRAFT_353922 [Glonium stellatum]
MNNATSVSSQNCTSLTLSELFQQIVRRFQALLEKNSYVVNDSDLACRLDDMLLKLRHWSNEIKFDQGVLDLLETKSTNLTQATRFFLKDIDFHLRKVEQACNNGKQPAETEPSTTQNSRADVLDQLQKSVDCLNGQVAPYCSFFSVETKKGAVWRLRQELANTQTGQRSRTQEPVPGPSASRGPILQLRGTSPSHSIFPRTSVVDNSDSHPLSPWSRKVILSLDGGGIRVYTSLLILRGIMDIIASIESNSQPEDLKYAAYMYPLEINEASADYPWLGRSLVKPGKQRSETESSQQDPESSTENVSTLRKSNFHPSHYFDYIFGAGTGGLAAIALGRMHISINETLEQLDVLGNEVFGKRSAVKEVPRAIVQPYVGAWKDAVTDVSQFGADMTHEYTLNTLEKALENIIGDHKDITTSHLCLDMKEEPFRGDPKKCRTVVVAQSLRRTEDTNFSGTACLFHSFDTLPSMRPSCRLAPISPPLFDVAKITLATQGLFLPVNIGSLIFRDATKLANNPSVIAVEEVELLHEQHPQLLLSIGSGAPDPEDDIRELQRTIDWQRRRSLAPSSSLEWVESDPFKTKIQRRRRRKDAGPFNDMARDLTVRSESIHQHLLSAHAKQVPIHRFNVPGLKDEPLDEWQPRKDGSKTKAFLEQETTQYLAKPEVNAELLKVAWELVNIRRRRAETERWEQFATDFIYTCPEKTCPSATTTAAAAAVPKVYPTRADLRTHGIEQHSIEPVADTVPATESRKPPALFCSHEPCPAGRGEAFGSLAEVGAHLKAAHGIAEPRLLRRYELERWLDQGRVLKTETEAFGVKPKLEQDLKGRPSYPARNANFRGLSDGMRRGKKKRGKKAEGGRQKG